MRYEELKDAIENAKVDISGTACDVLDYVLDRFDEDDEIEEYEVYDAIVEECDNYFTYYSYAWDYLMVNNITDFEDAIRDGVCMNVCSIAFYYLEAEIRDNLYL